MSKGEVLSVVEGGLEKEEMMEAKRSYGFIVVGAIGIVVMWGLLLVICKKALPGSANILTIDRYRQRETYFGTKLKLKEVGQKGIKGKFKIDNQNIGKFKGVQNYPHVIRFINIVKKLSFIRIFGLGV